VHMPGMSHGEDWGYKLNFLVSLVHALKVPSVFRVGAIARRFSVSMQVLKKSWNPDCTWIFWLGADYLCKLIQHVLVVWAVIPQVEPSKHCEAEGSHQTEQRVLFCVWVSGEAFVLCILIVCLYLFVRGYRQYELHSYCSRLK
jgi:hypothetical protein